MSCMKVLSNGMRLLISIITFYLFSVIIFSVLLSPICLTKCLTNVIFIISSEVEHRSVVLGMAQLENKPSLACAPPNILTEMPCDSDNTGELNDALIDDQVMVFPKWQATCKY